MTSDLSQLTLDELLSLDERVRLAIEERKFVQKSELKAKFEAEAAKYGLTLAELLNAPSLLPTSAKKSLVAPKYRNPSDPHQTWTGRGRTPKWLEALEEENDREFFRIKE